MELEFMELEFHLKCHYSTKKNDTIGMELELYELEFHASFFLVSFGIT